MDDTIPFLKLLRRVRETHHITQEKLDVSMGLPSGAYRHIESGRRPLPSLLEEREDNQIPFVEWLRRFVDRVQPTEAEQGQIWTMARQMMLKRFVKALRQMDGIRHAGQEKAPSLNDSNDS